MARNGSGTYSNPYPNFVSGTVISSSEVDANNSDVATALTQSIAVDGQSTVTASLPMNANKFTGLAVGAAATDSLNLGQAQAEAMIWCGTAGGSANAITLSPTPAITAYAAGQRFVWMASGSVNTGATTVAISGLSAIALQDNGAALVAGNHAASKMFLGILNTTSTMQIMQVQSSGTDPLIISSLTVSGTSLLTGVTTHGDDVVSDTDSTDDLGTTSVRWANLFVDGITATDQITATGFTGTLDGIIGNVTPAAGTFTTGSFSGTTSHADNVKSIWGTGNDLEIFNDGTNSTIRTTTANPLVVKTAGFQLVNAAFNQFGLKFDEGNAVDLYFAGVSKFITQSTGATVKGILTTTGAISVDDTTDSTSGITGSIHTDGGLGVAKAASVDGVLTVGAGVTGQIKIDGGASTLARLDWQHAGVSQGFIRLYDTTGGLVIGAADSSTAHVTILESGNTTFNTGNLVIATSGKGIDFSATADGAGTDTSELLDDYEEGTWTPVIAFSTVGNSSIVLSLAVGTYVKVGALVTAHYTIRTSTFTHTTASGSLQLTGVPYSYFAGGAGQNTGNALARFGGITKANFTQVGLLIPNGGATATFSINGEGQAYTTVAAGDMPSAGTVDLTGTIVYRSV